MATTAYATVAALVLAGCQYNGRPLDSPDADPTRPDADPNRPDADLTHPDAREVPDAPPGTPDAPPNAPDAMVPQCPATYTPINGSSYRWVPAAANWLAAETDCEDDAISGGVPTHLAVVDDSIERTTLVTGSGASLDNQWIGLTDLAAESTFLYVTGQAAVDPPGSPSGNSAMKDCVRLLVDRSYQARDCTNTEIYVCECDGFTADPARFPNYPNGN